MCYVAPFLIAAVIKGTHIVEPVSELDNYNSYILTHCKQYLSDILCLLLVLGEGLDLFQLCNAVYEHSDITAEFLLQYFKCTICILNYIVKQSRTDSICIHAKLKQDICHCKRVSNVWLSRFSFLTVVIFVCKLICRNDL